MTMLNPNRRLSIPCDCRLPLIGLWLSAVLLLAVDSLDGHVSLLAAWALLVGLGATTWTAMLLHEYSRQVVLEVMSMEHRQQTPGMAPLATVRTLAPSE